MKIVIAPDKFKGSLSASAAAAAMARGFRKVYPEAAVQLCPIADGGEGTARALCDALQGEWITCTVHDPMHHPVEAGYAWLANGLDGVPTAVIEMSEASGLALVPPGQRKAQVASTYGTGELMRDAIERGAKRVIVGLGGSATTDGGVGMAHALGYRFVNRHGEIIGRPVPENLLELEEIISHEAIEFPEVIAACDVQNPLLGPRGTAMMFAPQKGATPEEVAHLEAALSHLSGKVRDDLDGVDHAHTPGAGAAGGLGYGLLTFCGAKIRPGFDLVAEILHLEEAVANADLVLTGEGSLDVQTLEGKGPAGVGALARRYGKPVIAFGGRVAQDPRLEEIFDAVVPIADRPMALEEAIGSAELLLERAAARTAALCVVGVRVSEFARS